MKISVIIPTFNEASNIARLIKHVKQYGKQAIAEIVVSDAASTDDTVAAASVEGAVVVVSPQKGRAFQMNHAVQFTTGNILYFIHADVIIPTTFVADINDALASGYGFGSYRFRFDSPRRILKFNAFFTRFNLLSVRGGDQTLFITRRLFEELGGFDPSYTIMEDYDILRRASKIARFRLIQKDVVVSARKYDTNSWLQVQIANITAMIMFRLGYHPNKIAATYKRMLNYR